jgi:hypothetical protein
MPPRRRPRVATARAPAAASQNSSSSAAAKVVSIRDVDAFSRLLDRAGEEGVVCVMFTSVRRGAERGEGIGEERDREKIELELTAGEKKKQKLNLFPIKIEKKKNSPDLGPQRARPALALRRPRLKRALRLRRGGALRDSRHRRRREQWRRGGEQGRRPSGRGARRAVRGPSPSRFPDLARRGPAAQHGWRRGCLGGGQRGGGGRRGGGAGGGAREGRSAFAQGRRRRLIADPKTDRS